MSGQRPEPEQHTSTRRGGHHGLRESGAFAAAALAIVLVAGLLIIVFGGRRNEAGQGASRIAAAKLPMTAISSGISISLTKATMSAGYVTLTFRIEAANPAATPDLRSLGFLTQLGLNPLTSMALDGLIWDQAFVGDERMVPAGGGTPIPVRGPPTGPIAGWTRTIPFRLAASADRPVTVEIRNLIFTSPPSGPPRNIVKGKWRFSFTPTDIAQQVPAKQSATGPLAIQAALDALRRASLVFSINKSFVVGGQDLTLLELAADRDITYLVYRTGDGQPAAARPMLAVNGIPVDTLQLDSSLPAAHPTPTIGPSTFWLAYKGLPPETTEIRFDILGQFSDPPGLGTPGPNLEGGSGPFPFPQFTMPIDLSPLKAAAAGAQPLRGSTAANGVKIEANRLMRGLVVSTIELNAMLEDKQSLVPDPGVAYPLTPSTLPKITATVNGTPLPVVGQEVDQEGEAATHFIHVFGLPAQGMLHLEISDEFFLAGHPPDAPPGERPLAARHPPRRRLVARRGRR